MDFAPWPGFGPPPAGRLGPENEGGWVGITRQPVVRNFAAALVMTGRPAEAQAQLIAVAELLDRIPRGEPAHMQHAEASASALLAVGRLDDARSIADRALSNKGHWGALREEDRDLPW